MMKKLNSQDRLYKIEIPLIGITGGIASGKSTFCKILKEKGHVVLDADLLVKNIYKKEETLNFIAKNCPASIKNKQINFQRLREWFFKDKKNKKMIESFIYKRLPDEFLSELENKGKVKYLFYDIPLLFEKDMKRFFDLTVCVYIPKKEQIKRLMKRDRISLGLAEKILENQMDIEEKKLHADIVIDNFETPDLLNDLASNMLASL